MVTERNNFVNIREVLARVTSHPMLKNVNLEQVIRYTTDFIGIVGCPTFYFDKEEKVHIKDYRGVLPCELISINQVKDLKSGICLRSMTDTFFPHEHHHHCHGEHPHHHHHLIDDLTFKTQGNIIYTSFRTGEVNISYKAIPTDGDGLPLLVDNVVFLKALELYIKVQMFTNLFDEGKLNANILTHTEQQYAVAVAQCEKEFIMPSESELQSITNMWNTLIPRMRDFDKGFRESGKREYLIKH